MRASTSIQVYHSEIKGEKENSQDALILSAFVAFGRPATARMIQNYLKSIDYNLEINVMSRSVNNLHKETEFKKAKIIFMYDGKCEVTGRQAKFYEPILKLENGQTKLF